MARQLYRSGSKFLGGVLAALSLETETPYADIVSSVIEDEGETYAVDKTLNVVTLSKYAEKTGDGPTATYRLTESGVAVRDALEGV